MEQKRNFYAGLVQLSQFYGIILQQDDYENIAMHAWDHIGNKDYRVYVQCEEIIDGKVNIPCNADIIEAVLYPWEDFQHTDGIDTWTAALYNRNVETWIEAWKRPTEPLYHSGTLVNYEEDQDYLYIKDHHMPNKHIIILYKGIHMDDVGLPFLNFKEVDAIAKYCAWIVTQKKAMMTKDQATFQMAQMLNQQWKFAVDDARTPIYLNQNDMDRILNANSSWDRKRYGRSFKPAK